MTLFAGVALLLATIGDGYGVVAYSVSQRQRELGLRLALGARSTDITRLVLGSGFRIASAGALVGLAGAVLASRYLETIPSSASPDQPTCRVEGTARTTRIDNPEQRAVSERMNRTTFLGQRRLGPPKFSYSMHRQRFAFASRKARGRDRPRSGSLQRTRHCRVSVGYEAPHNS